MKGLFERHIIYELIITSWSNITMSYWSSYGVLCRYVKPNSSSLQQFIFSYMFHNFFHSNNCRICKNSLSCNLVLSKHHYCCTDLDCKDWVYCLKIKEIYSLQSIKAGIAELNYNQFISFPKSRQLV